MSNLIMVLIFMFTIQSVNGQSTFSIDGQIRHRFEFRNGYKTLQSDSSKSVSFFEQRTRLGVRYKNELIELYLQPQDVRIWGSTPLVNNSNGFFTMFNAWVKIKASPFISVKVGRQVFSYDNQRILGGLNWAAQGRAHDAVLFEYKNDSNQIELQVGAAYNALAGTGLKPQNYNLAGNYKTMQFVRFHYQPKWFQFSVLVMNAGREDANQKLYFELTSGALIKMKFKSFRATLEGYYQYGRTTANLPTNAFLLTGKFGFVLKSFSINLATDFLSGTNFDAQGIQNNSFNPWMGTNHAYYGHLDYFYVGNSHQGVGLLDSYLELAYTFKNKLKLKLNYHAFFAPAKKEYYNNEQLSNAFIGQEIDFVLKYPIKKYLNLSMGYGHLFGTTNLEILKPSGTVNQINNWAWLMLDVNLELFKHQIKKKKTLESNTRF